MSSDDGKNGVFDRLATKLFASTSSPLSAFADQQRADRLASCRQLESIFYSCKSEAENNAMEFPSDALTSDDITVATSRSGIRIARYFRWNLPHADRDNSDSSEIVGDTSTHADGKTLGQGKYSGVKSKFSHGCHKETHELWACRALALGCGNYLSDLRRCWDETAQIHVLSNSPTDESSQREHDHQGSNHRADACREIQQNMAKCVTKNAAELAERIEARKKK